MTRVPIKQEIQDTILTKSRRRCCVCFGLNRDVEIKSGQLAHLDRDSSNADEDNIAFLCLVHHDWYDSSTSQSKGPQIGEVRRYRGELYAAMAEAMNMPVAIGNVPTARASEIAGHYRSGDPERGASVDVFVLGDGILHVVGLAYRGASAPLGPNIGEIEFDTDCGHSGHFRHYAESSSGAALDLDVSFVQGGMRVSDHTTMGYHGHGVTFGGQYKRVGPARLRKRLLEI